MISKIVGNARSGSGFSNIGNPGVVLGGSHCEIDIRTLKYSATKIPKTVVSMAKPHLFPHQRFALSSNIVDCNSETSSALRPMNSSFVIRSPPLVYNRLGRRISDCLPEVHTEAGVPYYSTRTILESRRTKEAFQAAKTTG